ncbi:MAG: tetratricopeptide repeat protein [Methanosphaera sp.]|nr:tetratricopeptide repeat protein [Methanosphaera sp.]
MADTNTKLEEAFDLVHINPEESLLLFDEILESQPQNTEAINGKASAYMKLNKIDWAEELFDNSISIKATTAALINKGIIAKKRQDYENALKYYNQANKINPRIKNITCILKNDVFDLLDLDDDQELEMFSKEANLLLKKGLNYKKENRYWDSLECYELAIQKDERCKEYLDSLIHEVNIQVENQFLFKRPTYSDTQESQLCITGLQKLLLESNPNEAMTYFNKVLKINPENVDTLNYKAIILFNQARYDQSIKYFDKCLEIDENYYYALFNKSLVLIRTKKLDEAFLCFEKLLNNPDSSSITKRYNSEDIKKFNQINN